MTNSKTVIKRYRKPTVGKHSTKKSVNNPIKSFSAAHTLIANNPGKKYISKNGKSFKAEAGIAKRGKHKNTNIIRFKTEKSTTPAYKCCWNCQSNCNGTHIDIYSEVIK
jgi:hypothetical protein